MSERPPANERGLDAEARAARNAAEAAEPKAFGVLPSDRRFRLRRAKFAVIADVLADLAAAAEGRAHADDGPPRVLDAGIGQAKLQRVYAHRAPERPLRWVGLDLHRFRLDLRREVPGIERVQASVTALPFPDRTFDAVVCSYVLQHVLEPAAAVAELARVLAPGGLCALAVPNHPQPLKALAELFHPLVVALERRRGREFSYGAQTQFWNLPRLKTTLTAAGLRPERWQGLGFVTGGPLKPLENVEAYYRANLAAGAALPRLTQDLVVFARKEG